MTSNQDRSMRELQESDYGEGRDYTRGAPHLSHPHLRSRIEAELTAVVGGVLATQGRCRAIEVGAGHGVFTDTLVRAGASVTVTEMSAPSADLLRRRFAGNTSVRVVDDPDGEKSREVAAEGCDLIVMVSVLHHIPDYLAAVESLCDALDVGGAFYCTQDPLWYPRRSHIDLARDRGSYLMWRATQGNLGRGLRTRARRLRGVYDEGNPSDMVEYHVVREGVDQIALRESLETRFRDVRERRYWSTQSRALQRLGDRRGWQSTFGLEATGRLSAPGAA